MSLPGERPIRATLFGYFDLNPYLCLYKQALENQGVIVHLERTFDLDWLLTKGKFCDVVHLHWIETAYTPSGLDIQIPFVRKLIYSRYFQALRGALRLISFVSTLCLAKLQGKTIVYTVHNLAPHDRTSLPLVILNRIAHRIVLSLSDRIHVHNHHTREIIETVYNRKKGVIVVPLGNYVGYYPNQISQAEARRQLCLTSDAFVYLFLGLVRPYKGLEDLIDAFEGLGWPTGQLLIVGHAFDIDYKEKILDLCRCNPAIKLIPEFVPDEVVQLYMNACDVCVLPYKNMTTSSAAMLAWSFGRPVIVPAITSFPEVVTPETGILYESSETNALVSALRRAREHSWSESKILGYARRFDWSILGPQLAGLYQEL